jgi:hypothetical protein
MFPALPNVLADNETLPEVSNHMVLFAIQVLELEQT